MTLCRDREVWGRTLVSLFVGNIAPAKRLRPLLSEALQPLRCVDILRRAVKIADGM